MFNMGDIVSVKDNSNKGKGKIIGKHDDFYCVEFLDWNYWHNGLGRENDLIPGSNIIGRSNRCWYYHKKRLTKEIYQKKKIELCGLAKFYAKIEREKIKKENIGRYNV